METPFFTQCLFEFIGTLVLILMGDGVVANHSLKGTKGAGSKLKVVAGSKTMSFILDTFLSENIHSLSRNNL